MTHKRRVKNILWKVFLLTAIFFIFAGGIGLLWLSSLKIPDLGALQDRKIAESTKIYDRTGTVLLYDIHEDIKRTIIPYDEISKNVKNATVAIEDDEFWEHRGVKPRAFMRAVIANFREGRFSQGGSTITQQVVKKTLLTDAKLISRKLKEWVLALKLERVLSKEEILALYLNEIPYGGSVYGISEASRTFFGKPPSDLTLAESAYLASIPNAPTYYSPYGNNRDKLEERKDLVLRRMKERGFITDEEFAAAMAEEVVFAEQESFGIKAPHFVMFIREYLEEKYGDRTMSEKGFRVVTTLDYDLQKTGEELVRDFALKNAVTFNAKNAALVAIEPKTGQILTMVGSRDYFDKEIDGNFNVAVAERQPGSSFKPFAYAAAFNKGYTDRTVLFDLRTQFSTTCEPNELKTEETCYSPENYDRKFRGPVSLREALAQSINVPAIKILYLAGMKDTLSLARDMGVRTLDDPDRYGLTLVLGGGEVTLLDMTSAYSVFANEGVRNSYTGILEIRDKDGNIVESFKERPVRVLPEQTALLISDILSDDAARAPLFGVNSLLNFPSIDVAVKTGTTNDYRDAWVIGYNPSIAVGAWAGNNDNSPMLQIAGLRVSPLWHSFLDAAFKKYPPQELREPDPIDTAKLKPILRGLWQGGTSYYVDKYSGLRATESTPAELREERVVKNVHSILYWVDKNDPLGPPPENPDADPQFKYWEYAVRKWVAETGIPDETDAVIPTGYDSVHGPQFAPRAVIVSPASGSGYAPSERIAVQVQTSGQFPIARIDYSLDGRFIGSSESPPFGLTFSPRDFGLGGGIHTLTATVYDIAFNKTEAVSVFTVGQ